MIWFLNNNEDLKMEYRILNDNEDFGMRLWEKIDEFDGHEGWQSPDMDVYWMTYEKMEW